MLKHHSDSNGQCTPEGPQPTEGMELAMAAVQCTTRCRHRAFLGATSTRAGCKAEMGAHQEQAPSVSQGVAPLNRISDPKPPNNRWVTSDVCKETF
jgi:hypothetical protein